MLHANAHQNRKSKTTNELLEILAIETRNARLAMLSYNATEVSAGRKTANELKSAFCGYFHDFSTKFICFQDLKRYLPFLPREQQEELLMFASNHARQLKADFGGLDVRIHRLTARRVLIQHSSLSASSGSLPRSMPLSSNIIW